MRKYRKYIALCLLGGLLLCLLGGCAPEPDVPVEDLPVLRVYIPMNMETFCTMEILRDSAFVRKVAQEMGYELELHKLPGNMDYNEVALLDFSGILLTDDPSWVVPLAKSRKLMTISSEMKDFEYGQYNQNMYGYVLDDPSCEPESMVILANREALQQTGKLEIPFTPESVYDLLAELKENYRIPLAVSGMPTEAGFAPLLALFDIAPSGGREMYVEDGEVIYDKISDSASDYLRYIQRLYADALIPGEVVELTQYSCAKMIAQNVAAMAVFTDPFYVDLAQEYAKEQNCTLVRVEIPVEAEQLHSGIFSRVVGYVSKDGPTEPEAMVFFRLLQQQLDLRSGETQDNAGEMIPEYQLFSCADIRQAKQDPREVCPVYVYWLYQKEYLDMTYLDGTYCKILLGEADVHVLKTSADAWMEDGKLVNLIAGKYWAQTHKGG